jgi:hypothetical protein
MSMKDCYSSNVCVTEILTMLWLRPPVPVFQYPRACPVYGISQFVGAWASHATDYDLERICTKGVFE